MHTLIGVACLALAVAGSLAATARAGGPAEPPRPVLVADGGAHRQAARGSYCWESAKHAICADTTDPIEYAPTLPARTGSTLTLRMGYPIETLDISADRGRPVSYAGTGPRARKFEVFLPEQRKRRLDLHIFARYDRGDGSFAIRIRQLGSTRP